MYKLLKRVCMFLVKITYNFHLQAEHAKKKKKKQHYVNGQAFNVANRNKEMMDACLLWCKHLV